MRLCMCIMRQKCWGGVFEPVEPPVEKPETPTTPPSTEDLLTIKIEENIMAVVGTSSWKRIIYGKGDYDNGKYVAVSSDLGDNWTLLNPKTVGHIATSTDGENWTQLALGELSGLNAVAYGNNTFVAVGNDGYTLASMYGGDWKITRITTTVSGSTSYPIISDVAFGNGKFVAVSAGNISTSTYGNSWTTKNVPVNGSTSWNAIAYGNGKFVAIATTGYVATSTDGSTWTTPKQVANLPYQAITYGNGKFVAVGYNGYISVSSDGSTWTTPKQVGTTAWYDVIYSQDRFVVVGGNYVTTSIDGVTWATPVSIKDAAGNNVHANGIVAMS